MARTIATCGPMTTRWVLPPILTPVNVRDVGGETIKNARLRIGEVFPGTKYRPRNSVDMKFGSDFLPANRLLIVPGKDAIVFTYNGGAIFQQEGQTPRLVGEGPGSITLSSQHFKFG
jgi:hypothetical protein